MRNKSVTIFIYLFEMVFNHLVDRDSIFHVIVNFSFKLNRIIPVGIILTMNVFGIKHLIKFVDSEPDELFRRVNPLILSFFFVYLSLL